jgi:hypothetical protein
VVTLQIRARDGAGRLFHDAARLAPEQVERMTGHLLQLAQAALEPTAQEVPVRQLSMLPDRGAGAAGQLESDGGGVPVGAVHP